MERSFLMSVVNEIVRVAADCQSPGWYNLSSNLSDRKQKWNILDYRRIRVDAGQSAMCIAR